MSFDQSPSFDQFQNGMPDPLPNPEIRRKKFRAVLSGIASIVALIAVFVILKNTHVIENLTATGLVRGRVTNESGQPFHGSVFILGTELAVETDENGYFELSGVPAGDQILIIADDFIGRDVVIRVNTASELQVGELRFEPTAMPPK
ncbi:MAG: carboxypeptidase-like regulatory domain-containing protein [Anaerolineales bacterium]|uniref:hypothetical protein n=1 Tax=Candidatus Villigracilis vicinus TaxID=3140679 RepID=UPI0031363A81|nr:carboxypeptidase-like regulatory domain-containing protein [Anaerolineales bacterium]